MRSLVVGSIVEVLAGREKGELFVVIQNIDNDNVYLSNGNNRKIDKPKKKKVKHLRLLDFSENLAKRINEKENVLDSDIRKILKLYKNVEKS